MDEPDSALVDFSGDHAAQAKLLKTLIEAGYQISSFHETKMDLEDVFLRVTTGSVQ
jgi:hypothetical protein